MACFQRGVPDGVLHEDSPTIQKQFSSVVWGITQCRCLARIPTALFMIITQLEARHTSACEEPIGNSEELEFDCFRFQSGPCSS